MLPSIGGEAGTRKKPRRKSSAQGKVFFFPRIISQQQAMRIMGQAMRIIDNRAEHCPPQILPSLVRVKKWQRCALEAIGKTSTRHFTTSPARVAHSIGGGDSLTTGVENDEIPHDRRALFCTGIDAIFAEVRRHITTCKRQGKKAKIEEVRRKKERDTHYR